MEALAPTSRQFVKATINDVARRAGVSITTVSLYLRGRTSACSAETAERIDRSVAALQYVPGPSAGRARGRATRTIGLCLENQNDIGQTFDSRQTYHERLYRAISRVADDETYGLLRYPVKMRRGGTANFFLDGRVDGVLLDLDFDRSSIEMAASVMPIVLVNRHDNVPIGCGAAATNENDTLRLAIDHLLHLGHRRIAHLAAPIEMPIEGCVEHEMTIIRDRAAGIRQAEAVPTDVATRRCRAYIHQMRKAGLFDPALIGCIGSWADTNANGADAQLAAWMALPEPPTAIVGACDKLAIAMLDSAKSAGLKCPRDLSVVGIDNRTAASEADPPLTTVDVPVEALGQSAMRLLIRMLGGEDIPLAERILELPVTELVVRMSTAPRQ